VGGWLYLTPSSSQFRRMGFDLWEIVSNEDVDTARADSNLIFAREHLSRP